MRLWLKDADRKPDPKAVRADGRKALLVGTVFWLVAVIVAILCWPLLTESGTEWMLWCAVTGFALGLLGFVAVRLRRENEKRDR